MKILWLSGYSPWPANHGGRIRLYNLVRQLLGRGHTIDLWCICNEQVQWSEPSPPGLALRHFPARERDSGRSRLEALFSRYPEPAWAVTTPEVEKELAALGKSPPNVVVLGQAYVGSLAPLIPASIPFVLDAHNAEWWLSEQIARSQFTVPTRTRFSVDAHKFVRLESELLRSAAAVMAVSDDDAKRLRGLARTHLLEVRPSGVDTDYFGWVDHSKVRDDQLLMTGTLGYAPNLDACAWMRAEIMPMIRAQVPTAKVDLVGGADEEARSLHSPENGVNVVGAVDDVRPYMEAADVFAVPLRMGSGTRLKILEALAAGLPVVATTIAAEGLDLPEGLVLIGDTVESFAAHVVNLLKDPALRTAMSIAGRHYVEQHFSWVDIAAEVESTLSAAVASRMAGAAESSVPVLHLAHPPLVSIGLPVRNGERYLAEALDSLLAQDYPNFELIISDNASTDGTQRICGEYVKRDDRITYHRLEQNVGAIRNFNQVFELAKGKYFMWAAFDDLRDPRFMSACVAALEAHPEAVLCCTGMNFIDEKGNHVESPRRAYAVRPIGSTRVERVGQIAQGEAWFDIYGLARRDVLATIRRQVPTWGFDVVVVLEMCLRGTVLMVPEPLFSYRRFETKVQHDLAVELSAASSRESIPPCWTCLTLELVRSIAQSPAPWFERQFMVAEFLLRFCVANVPVAAGIRKDLTPNLTRAWKRGEWGTVGVLLIVGVLIYPLHNRATRSLLRFGRRLRGRP